MSEKLKKQALQLINEQPITLKELAEKMGITEKRAYNLLRALFQEGRIKSFADEEKQRRYTIDETYQPNEDKRSLSKANSYKSGCLICSW